MGSPGHTSRDTRDNMIPLDKQHTGMSPSTAFNLTQLKFESANSSESESNMVWIILFSLLIFISVLSNSLYILYNIRRRCVTHTILSVFFPPQPAGLRSADHRVLIRAPRPVLPQ